MIRNGSLDDLPELEALFARANDAPYPLERVAKEKCFGAGLAGEPLVRLFQEDERLLGAAVRCGKWLRLIVVARDARRRGIGTELLRDANPAVIAAEPGNYFTPGVPPGLLPFFRGYAERASTWNLEVDLGAVDDGSGPSGATHAESASRTGDVLDFIEREFGAIWRFEASHAPENLFFTEERGAITGFVVHDANNRGLGWFGPTGIASAHRGKGLGRTLLLASLREMRRQGYARAVIPWTDAIEFYRKSCGAEPAHRFVALVKQQPIDSAP